MEEAKTDRKKNVFIIAEAGVNHNGCLTRAKELIDIAVESGANAVKFQTFNAAQLLTASAPKAEYQIKNMQSSESQYEMIKKLELSEHAHSQLIDYAHDKKIEFISTPFDLPSVYLLAKKFDLPYLKVASGEITNAPLLLSMAQTGKSIILSTGMSSLGEIENALSILAFGYLNPLEFSPTSQQLMEVYYSNAGQEKLQEKVTILHCTTEYPAPFAEVNLRVIETLQHAFHLPIGYSDHTPGIEIAIAAVARGAIMIEKHFTTDKTLPGPDHQASLEPHELKNMVTAIRHVEVALGKGMKMPTSSEIKNRLIARKSLVALQPIKKGEPFTSANLGLKRPGSGLSGMYYWEWLGKLSADNYQTDELIKER